MKNIKIKLIVGFRRDQEYSIDAEEAHKAYYLFLNPDKRGIFNNGLAMIGSNIQDIVPDYHGTMGWNQSHNLDSDDWNEIHSKGIDVKIRNIMSKAKELATVLPPEKMNTPLSSLITDTKKLDSRGGMKSIGELLG